jgi:penicillin-binding protein 1A
MEERPYREWLRERRERLGAWARAMLKRRRVRLGLAVALSCVFGLSLLAGAAWQTCGFGRCPDVARLTAYRPDKASLLLDRAGRVISQLVPADHDMVRLRDLPGHVAAAFLAIEDRRFFAHGAVDLRRVAGAVWANLRSRAFDQGFSTLTMQLARNLFPEDIPGARRTTARKLLEIRVAQEIEARFSKPEILELYLNHIYFGNGARGIEPAAQQYFRCPAARLTLAQAALLAALPKAPSHYDPRLRPAQALARRNLVLARMAEQGRVGREAAAAAAREPLGVSPPSPREPSATGFARYFAEEVRRELEERFGEALYARPLRIWTTLDVDAQHAAEQELARQLRAIEIGKLGRFAKAAGGESGVADRLEGAVVVLAATTGDVLAWVGGRDYGWSQFDRVIRARRQAGSAWKPFVFAAALESGYALSQPIADTPLTVPMSGGEVWQPRNYDGSFEGQVSLREALVRSRNVPTVRLALAVGLTRVADLARRTGISGEVPILPSMPLGTLAVSPLELTRAYTAFATLGQESQPRLVLRVETAGGQVLWTAPPPRPSPVLAPAVAFLLDDALREALERGSGSPGRRAVFEHAAAGKTGTSTGGDDVWFIGYTPDVVAGVWIGFDQPRTVADQATGGRLAAPVWGRLMSRLYAGKRPPLPWPVPPGVVSLPIDATTGLVVAAGCEGLATPNDDLAAGREPAAVRREYFMAGREPAAVCPGEGQQRPLNAFYTQRLGIGGGEEGTIQISRSAEAAAAMAPGVRGAAEGAPTATPGASPGAAPGAAGPASPGEADAETEALLAARAAEPAPNEQELAEPRRGGRPGAAAAPAPEGTSGEPGGSEGEAAGAQRGGAPGQESVTDAGGRRGGLAAPPAEGLEAPPAAGVDLSGRWEVTNSVDETSDPALRGQRLSYRISLRQEGPKITGEGERMAENGSPLPDEERTAIHLTGVISGRQVSLQFVERGGRRISGGSFRWRLASGGGRMAGTFSSGAADSHGASLAARIQ